ncbi:hypothetical protein BLL52_3491 [Rhodoferax antarcticus ANT.BR]|uniref:Uncharacterized protein n=1 Tax=Rhodoferax antarcticus ANT.BR TaxID=1111071 RepID=A0A1Q8YBK7_9BURK|nr:hypothetical protein BLL52_3491 [Rhodoferax antarcticus ANT.BR]
MRFTYLFHDPKKDYIEVVHALAVYSTHFQMNKLRNENIQIHGPHQAGFGSVL